jgi:hypothetical protein
VASTSSWGEAMNAAMLRNKTAVHEAGHAVIGALIRGVGVRVVAAIAGERAPHVSTLHRRSGTPVDAMAAEAGFALVALAGPAAEFRCAREPARIDEANAAARQDEANAEAAVLRMLRHGGLDRILAADLVEVLRGQAAELVEQAWPLIERVAAALAEGGPLTGAEVDALIENI